MTAAADRLRALADKATPGPWVHEGLGYGAVSSTDPLSVEAFGRDAAAYGGALVCESATKNDRRLIALAPVAVREWAACLDALENASLNRYGLIEIPKFVSDDLLARAEQHTKEPA